MLKILLVGERLAYRSFNGANKALPVLASSLWNAGFRKLEQLDLELPDVTIDNVLKSAETADLIIFAGAMSPQWPELDLTLSALKRHLDVKGLNPPVIVGGYAAKNASDILAVQPAITAFFDGEGEIGVVQIAEAVARGDFLETRASIPGLCFMNEGGVYHRSIAPRVRNFDDIDQNFGLRHDPYKHNMDIFDRSGVLLKTAQLYTQRGCPWVCGFCNKSTEDGRVARLSEMSLRKQLRSLKLAGYTSVYLDVDTFTVNLEGALKEAQILHEEGFVWGSNTRIDRIDLALMQQFVSKGCVYMFCGVEHISENVSMAVQKFNGSFHHQMQQAANYRGDVYATYRDMNLAGLPSSYFMILGLPSAVFDEDKTRVVGYRATTFEEDAECVRFGIIDCDPDYFNFNLLRFMPGTAAADNIGETPYSCVRPSGTAPVTAGYFLPRVRLRRGYNMGENHGVYRLCESVGPNQPTTTGVDPERVYWTIVSAIDCINYKISHGGKPTRLFVDKDIENSGLLSIDRNGIYKIAPLREFESLAVAS